MEFDLGLTGYVALVTGGTDGIGRAIAQTLGKAGCRVCICARSRDKVDQVVSELRRDNIEASGVAGNCANQADVSRIVSNVLDEYGGLDVLVNNVGGSAGDGFSRGEIVALTLDDAINTFTANVGTAFLMSKQASAFLRGGAGGSILNIGSITSVRPSNGLSMYGAAKAALSNMTRAMAREWAPTVRANALVVGHVATARTQRMRSRADVQDLESKTLLGRLARPEDVAAVAACVVSPSWGWVTGALIPVDGGALAK